MVNKYTVFNYAPEMYDKDKKLVDSIHFRVPYLGRGRSDDAYELAKILKEYGYKGLRIASDKEEISFMSLDKLLNVNPGRILRVAQDMYVQANKRMSSFGNPINNPKSPFYKKRLSLDQRIEDDGQGCLF